MAISKKIRQKIFEKSNGKCGYCGSEININKFQVDHIEPASSIKHIYKEGDAYLSRKDEESNLMATCVRCNHYKRAENLERFRHQMKTLHERLLKIYIVKVACNFGIIKLTPFDGIFSFEKEKNSNINKVQS